MDNQRAAHEKLRTFAEDWALTCLEKLSTPPGPLVVISRDELVRELTVAIAAASMSLVEGVLVEARERWVEPSVN
jgi:hypothetical protein